MVIGRVVQVRQTPELTSVRLLATLSKLCRMTPEVARIGDEEIVPLPAALASEYALSRMYPIDRCLLKVRKFHDP